MEMTMVNLLMVLSYFLDFCLVKNTFGDGERDDDEGGTFIDGILEGASDGGFNVTLGGFYKGACM